jgi:hypothetical protein
MSGVSYMPLYHPAAALHNGSLVNELQRDFDGVRRYLATVLTPAAPAPTAAAVPAPHPAPASSAAKANVRSDPEQLSLL